MKGLILYFTLTGNTKQVIVNLNKRVRTVDFELNDIMNEARPNFEDYDVIGFATFTDHLEPPKFMRDYVDSMPMLDGKYAFVLNTYGSLNGPTLKKMKKMVESKGLKVLSGHSLHTPQNYPPMIKRGVTSTNAPSKKELDNYHVFLEFLEKQLLDIKSGNGVNLMRVKGEILSLPINLSDDYTKKEMGMQTVNEEKCISCGKCSRVCPYKAVGMDKYPTFDHKKCLGCWACYNHCPKKAIETKDFKGDIFYNGPSELFKSKLI